MGIAVSEIKYIQCLNVGIDDYAPQYNKLNKGILIVDPKYMCSKIIKLPIIKNVMLAMASLKI